MIEQLFTQIIEGNMPEEEIKRFLLDLKAKGETSEDIASAARALIKACKPFPKPDYEFADLVGTGGDEQGTLNISTAAAFLVAAMGLPVAKHGNKSVSSKCGSADVLVSLGANLELSPEKSRECLDQIGFCFLLAPVYHPGMRHAMGARKALHTRTIFNLLGPLVNPARPPIQLTGVYDPALCRPMAETFKRLGSKSVLVVHGSGLDEIAIHGPTQAVLLKDGEISEFTLQPKHQESLESIRGGEPAENAAWLKRVLQGQATSAQNQAVALNAAALFGLAQAGDFYEQALETLLAGKAYDKLQAFIEFSSR
jgi:anthranilate phosphoribosyltransferase